jgi:hypothetical protein
LETRVRSPGFGPDIVTAYQEDALFARSWLGCELINALGRTTYQSPLCPRKRPSATAAQHVVMGQTRTSDTESSYPQMLFAA